MNLHSRTLIAIVVFGGILVSFLLFSSGTGRTTEVRVSSDGFLPRDVSVSAGDTVLFRNIGMTAHWIASDIHPTYFVYPGSDVRKCGKAGASRIFDSCRGIAPGESYRFRFDEAGEWGVNDHLEPRLIGTIRVFSDGNHTPALVEGLDASIGQFAGNISGFVSSLIPKDYEKVDVASVLQDDSEVRRMIQELGLPRTVEKVATEVVYAHAASECHAALHVVGNQAYEVLGAQAFGQCTAACFSGCYHGVIERMSAYGGERIFDEIRSVCGARATVFDRDQCFHGAGHGFLTSARYELTQAIDACRRLGEDDIRYWCYKILVL